MTDPACYTYAKHHRRDFGEWLFKNVPNDCKSKYEEVWEGANTNVKDLFDLAALAAFKGATAGSRPKGSKIEKARCILEATGFYGLAENGVKWLPDQDFDVHHHAWCDDVRKEWGHRGTKDWSYGRSAKLINVFIKTVMLCKHETLPDGKERAKWYAVHPPIDGRVLKGMRDACFGCRYKNIWIGLTGTNGKPCEIPLWTEFKCNDYKKVIKMIRCDLNECGYKDPLPLWKNERFFNP